MKGVFKEIVQKKQRPFWQILLVILFVVILVNRLITACNSFGKYAGVASIIVLITSAIVIWFIITKFLGVFSYRWVEGKLVFERIFGKKSKIILTVDIEEIEFIKPYNDVEDSESVEVTYKFVYDKNYDSFYVGQFQREQKKYRFIFKPSNRLVDIITKSLYEN